MCDCKKERMSEKQISAHENVSSRGGGWRNGCVSSLIAPLRWRVWLSPHQIQTQTFNRFLVFWMFWKRKTQIDKCWMTSEVFLYGCVFTVQGRPSTVASLNSCPTVKLTWVVLTEVEVLIDSVSPSWVISTDGFDAAATAILRSITFTPDKTHQNNLLKNSTLASIQLMGNSSFIEFLRVMLLRLAVLHTSALYTDNVRWHHLI